MKRVLQYLGILLLVLASATAASEANAGSASYMLGETKVMLNEVDAAGGGGFTFFAPHSNEATAVSAAKAVVQKSGGSVFWLTHGDGERNITFKLEGETYVVDPNRIFSDKGAKASLKPYSKEALAAVRGLAKFVLDAITRKRQWPIVGIHNNTNGNLSVTSYKSGANKDEASQAFAAPGQDPDDFIFVTTELAFKVLKERGFNVVLQARVIQDDGSLSVYCQSHNIPYVNVEAEVGHLSQQKKMLKAVTGT